MPAYQLVDQTYGDGTDRQLPVDRIATYLFVGDKIISTDEDLSFLVDSGDLRVSAGTPDETVTPVADRVAAENASSVEVLEVAADVVPAITASTTYLHMSSSTTGIKAITTSSSYPGQTVTLLLEAASGGSYTLAVTGGALTFDASTEVATVIRNAGGGGWVVTSLQGATIV